MAAHHFFKAILGFSFSLIHCAPMCFLISPIPNNPVVQSSSGVQVKHPQASGKSNLGGCRIQYEPNLGDFSATPSSSLFPFFAMPGCQLALPCNHYPISTGPHRRHRKKPPRFGQFIVLSQSANLNLLSTRSSRWVSSALR